jgi:hypothetical protein
MRLWKQGANVKSTNNIQFGNSTDGWPLQAARPFATSPFNHDTATFQADARKEELPGRLDWPGRPGGLEKPIAQQSEKDQLIDAVRES